MPSAQRPDPCCRLADRSRAVLAAAEAYARRRRDREVGPEHLLLAIADDDARLASLVLAAVPVPLDQLRRRLVGAPNGAMAIPSSARLSIRVRQTLELARLEAVELGVGQVGTEALLLALARQAETDVAGILAEFGATYDRLLALTKQILDAYATRPPVGVAGESDRRHATLRDLNAKIVAVRHTRQMAIDGGDVEAAQTARTAEKRLLADKVVVKKVLTDDVDVVALIEELDRVYEQVERLWHLVHEQSAGADPEDWPDADGV